MKQLVRRVREHRDGLLKLAGDILQRHQNQVNFGIPGTLTHEQAIEVAEFAEALRGVPAQPGFPHRVNWPQVPGCIRHLVSAH